MRHGKKCLPRRSGHGSTILLLSQVYPPDAASVGQHMADVAEELVRRGHRVRVLTSSRGYDDPSIRYSRRETLNGVDLHRLGFTSFGKDSLVARILSAILFTFQASIVGLLQGDLLAILVTTVPPTAPLAALLVKWVTKAPICYWVMDLHPDLEVSLGLVSEGSRSVRLLNWMNRRILIHSQAVIVLDHFMADRVNSKQEVKEKLFQIPPWDHSTSQTVVTHDNNPFRIRQNLGNSIVVMYSGNHGLANPLSTVVRAAQRLNDIENLVFLFVGGGVRKAEIEQSSSRNIRSLPYEPLADIRYSLAAADVHIVSVGDEVIGEVHPCKVYGAMAVGRPILLLGPSACHVSDIFELGDIGWHCLHNDVDGMETVLRQIAAAGRNELQRKGQLAKQINESHFGRSRLRGRVCDVIEGIITLRPESAGTQM